MASTHVLRVRRTDDPSSHLLVHVTRTSKTRPLDLKLVATEHEHLYHGSVKSNKLVDLQASKYNGGEDEWKAIVANALLQQRSEANLEALQGLETVAAVSGETCTLILRKNIGGVTKRLGAIELQQDDEREEINAFEWVDVAVAASDSLRETVVALEASTASLQAKVDELNARQDEFVKAKKEHDEQLLQKVGVLINSKKAETRKKQRELNAAAKGQIHKAGASSRGKRKAIEDEDEDEAGSLANGSDDDADDDDLDAEEEDGQRTPEQETEDEDSDDGGFAAPPPAATSAKATKATASSRDSRNRQEEKTSASEGTGKNGEAMEVDLDELPPRRELPFARTRAHASSSQTEEKTKAAAPAPVQDEDDTDDEL